MAHRPDIPALARLVGRVLDHPDVQQRMTDHVNTLIRDAQATAWDHGYATGLADTDGIGDQPNPYREPKLPDPGRKGERA